MATTTIQIEKPTKELLTELKKNFKSKTYDEVIQQLVRKKTNSMYRKLAGRKKITFAKAIEGLRDKSERI
ncbi:MAG: hypothetical protein COV47_04065 [Candidatus Diapherotrites archaeon CG11_big_fil_rev_8_21_14_0_20_37_9]|nr:MAG: hypothetical protein COV47_04065 [Candidatus Diapherotrites archaeon CG11_big_fil_rev_8_21_14_0_20_37_9]